MENEMENIEVADQETVCQPEETVCQTEETAEVVQPPVLETPTPKKRSTLTIVAISVAATLLVVALALGLTVGVLAGAELIDLEKWFQKEPEVTEPADMNGVVVASVGENTLTNGELQVYYAINLLNLQQSEYAYYLYYYYGVDLTQPLDELVYDETTGQTWKDLITDNALSSWHEITAMNMKAQAEGFQLSAEQQEYLDTLDTHLEEMAANAGYDSVEAMVKADIGATATVEGLKSFMADEYYYSCYFASLQEKHTPTQEQIDTYFTENEALLAQEGVTKESYNVDIRHILIQPEGGTPSEDGQSTVYSDEEWEACRQKAQEVLDTWKAGEATEDSFAQLAKEHSADGNASQGGIYTGVTPGYMVEPFDNWIFDETREYGNTDLVKTQFGYHVMFFVGKTYTWSSHCSTKMLQDALQYEVDTAKEQYPIETDRTLIVLS